MLNSTYNITLDFHETTAAQFVLVAKKADTARRVVATLCEDGEPYKIPNTCNAILTAHKPNEGIVTINCDIEGDKIVCDITEAITALPGQVDCEVKLYDAAGNMLTSPRFVLIVDDTIWTNGEDVEEGGEYPATIYAVGIESVEQTTTSTTDAGTNIVTVTLTDGSTQTFSVKNGSKGSPGEAGYTPVKGKDYFDGKDGYTPIKGKDYFDGKDGYTPVKGVDYFDGSKGDPGKDGYTPIKGKDYFDGEKGDPGQDGYTPIKGIDYFDGKDGYTPIKGKDYFDGKDGVDGYTPVKGVDYYTEADKAEIVESVILQIPPDEDKVSDITIDGKSIVDSSGIAAIPLASQYECGLVQVGNRGDGLIGLANVNGETVLYWPIAFEDGFTRRMAQGYKDGGLVDSSNFDMAVRVAMTDGVAKPWTEEQQAKARKRMGAVSLQDVLDNLPIYNGEAEDV